MVKPVDNSHPQGCNLMVAQPDCSMPRNMSRNIEIKAQIDSIEAFAAKTAPPADEGPVESWRTAKSVAL